MIQCTNCRKDMTPSEADEKLISSSHEKGMRFVGLRCSFCGLGFKHYLDPLDTGFDPANSYLCRCPTAGCTGRVCDIQRLIPDEPNKWGCGECGGTWLDDDELQNAISTIVAEYEHRGVVYERSTGRWNGIALADEPKNYNDVVETEA